MTLIDLGEVRDAPPPEPSTRPPRPAHRLLRFLSVLVVALVTLTAATPPPGRVAVVVPSRLGAEWMVAGDLLLVLDPVDRQQPQRSVAAFRLPGGEPAWQAPLPMAARFWGASARDGMLLMTAYQEPPDGRGSITVAMDRETGAYRWQQPGSAVALAGGGLLLEDFAADGSATLRAVDPCCGTLRWQARFTGGEITYRFTEGGVDRVVLSDARGRIDVRDAFTGAVRAAADLWPSGDRPYVSTQVVGDLLFTVAGTPSVVTAYGLDRLDRRWRTPVADVVFAVDCGPAVCFQTRAGGVRALDRVTGRLLWTDDGWNAAWFTDGRLVASEVRSAGPGTEELAVLDPATGRVLADLGRWEVPWRTSADGPVIGVRRPPEGGLVVAELDVAAATVRMLDVLPDAGGECQVVRDLLLCRRVDASLGLWPLRR